MKDQKALLTFSNVVEFFDYFIFIHLASIINPHFLGTVAPTWNKFFQIGVMYFVVPISMLVSCKYVDSGGRRNTVVGSTAFMALSTLSLVVFAWVVPDEGNIWIAIVYLMLRAIQGISMSIEPLVAKLYGIEDNGEDLYKIPFWTQLLSGAQSLGSLLAILTGMMTIYYSWSWRIPITISLVVVLIALVLRVTLRETREYVEYSLRRSSLCSWKDFFFALKKKKEDKQNFIFATILYCVVPTIGLFSLTTLTPHVLTELGLHSTMNVLKYNGVITIMSLTISTTVALSSYKKDISLKNLTASLYLCAAVPVGFFIFVPIQDLGLIFCCILQGILCGASIWNLIYGNVYKNFFISLRIKSMALSVAIGRIVAFILSVFIFPVLQEKCDIRLIALICGLALIGSFFVIRNMHVPSYVALRKRHDAE